MRRGWLRGYRLVTSRTSLPSLLMCLLSKEARCSHSGGYRRALGDVASETVAVLRSAGGRILARGGLKNRFKPPVNKFRASSEWQGPAMQPGTPLIHVCQVKDQVLLISDRSGHLGFKDPVWRAEHDYYLSQTAVLREGDTVVDVGAHIGVWSIYLAKKFPFIKVYALEPDPKNYACLLENLALNQVTNVVPCRMALAGTDGSRTLYSDPLGDGWATIHAGFATRRKVLGVDEVETTTIERLCRSYGIAHCRMLKISARGVVKEVLESLPGSVAVDYLCGEVDLEECGKATLEAASWRSARHFFWRTMADTGEGRVWSCVQQLPQGLEPDALVLDPVAARDLTGDPALIGRTQRAGGRD
jgi:FkbM family methyltransferase